MALKIHGVVFHVVMPCGGVVGHEHWYPTTWNVSRPVWLFIPYEAEGNDFLGWIMTGSELWLDHFQPEPKWPSKESCHPSSQKPIKNVQRHHQLRRLCSVFLTHEWHHANFLQKWSTVNTKTYWEFLKQSLMPAHWLKAMQDASSCLLAPDLVLSDYHLFGTLKVTVESTLYW